MPTWKSLAVKTLSTTLLLTQSGPLPYLALAAESVYKSPVNGEVTINWTTSDEIKLGSSFNPYDGLAAIDSDGDNVAVLVKASGEVDTSREGVYPITYSIENVEGEIFTMTRQVKVVNVDYLGNESQDNQETTVSNEQVAIDSENQGELSTPSTSEETNSDTSPGISQEELAPSKLKNVKWTLYDRSQKQELIDLIVNDDTGYYEGHINEGLKSALILLDESKLNQELLILKILSKTNTEKLALTLTVRDLLDESAGLKLLNEISYEIGDQLSLIPILNEDTTVVIHGIIDGDISNERAHYETGVQDEDYLYNVRFQITDEGLKTVYNQAPIIEGIQDTETSDFKTFDPKAGVIVKDDHDENLLSRLQVAIEPKDEKTQIITYRVTDSWGRTTEASRQVSLKSMEDSIENPLVDSAVKSTLADNSIVIKGIDYPGTESRDQRFKITFNTRSKRIFITEADGRSMNSRVEGDYFKLILYDAKGKVKKELVLEGRDRANAQASSAMNELINTGWRFAFGDVIRIWHYEPDNKVVFDGTIQDSGNENFSEGSLITPNMLRFNRFELTGVGLKKIHNDAPTITLQESAESNLTIYRGDTEADLTKGLTAQDNQDSAVDVYVVPFDFNTVGTREAIIIAVDSWGEIALYRRQITVIDKNDLDGVRINFTDKTGNSIFDLQFDEVDKQIKVLNQTETSFDSTNKSDVVVISIYNRSGKVRRTVRIKGTDNGNSSSIRTLQNFKYSEGDYINITPVDSKFVKITGTVTDLPNDVNYTQTSVDLDKYKNVRFQLVDSQFKYVYNEAPIIKGVDAKSIVRGESFDPLAGVSVEDDRDSSIPNDQIKVAYNQDALNRIGTTMIRYTVSDSWGRTTTAEREITVTAPNQIENDKIVIKKGEKEFLTIGFDSLNKKLQVLDFLMNDVLEGTDHEEAFKLTLYGSDKQEKGSVTLNYHTEVSETFINQVEALIFEEGNYITITSPIHDSIQVVKGTNQTESFDSEDKLQHSRIQLSNAGVTVIYNNAPKFKGVDKARVVYGNTFDPKNGVTVEDEDQNLTFTVSGNHIDEQGQFTAKNIGTYELTYTVTDSYGRTTIITRTVEIVPVYTTNEVQYYNDLNQLLFAIGINESATGFTYRLPETQPSITDALGGKDLDVPNGTLFKFTVYDTTGEIVDVLEVTEQTIIDENLFENLTSQLVRPGYRFSVEVDDLTKLKVTGRLDKDTEVDMIDYSNLTSTDQDAVKNVRFELTDNIVKAVYNEAPVIIIAPTTEDEVDGTRTPGSTDIIRNKALTKEAYNLLDGVTVSDDKDQLKLTVENVEVSDDMLVSELNSSIATIGQTYEVTYKVADSWGRESEPVTRQVTIRSAMDDVKIKFTYADDNFPEAKDRVAAAISVNMGGNGSISVETQESKFKYNDVQYGAFAITDATGNLSGAKSKILLGEQNTYDINTEFSGSGRTNSTSVFKQSLEAKSIAYGDKIKIKIYQSPFVYIDGTVLDAQEDYSQGARLASVLANSYFVVTPEGLKQEYSGVTMNESNQSQITFFNGVAGVQSFNMRLDNSDSLNLKLKVDLLDQEWLDTLDYSNSVLFRFELKASDGTSKKAAEYFGRRYPTTIKTHWDNQEISVGDYLKIIRLKENRLGNFKLYNLPELKFFPDSFSYEDVITERTYFDDVRFYMTTTGIIPVYNNPPVFHGVEDIDVLVGTSFNPLEGVTVTDEIDGNISQFSVSSTSVNTSNVGTQTITYTATDSWGRSTVHTRNIHIRPKLFDNKVQVFETNNSEKLAFEIVFDNQKAVRETQTPTKSKHNTQQLGGFTINRYSDEMLDSSQPTEDVFKLWVLAENGTEKAKVILQGRDTASSSKLNVLDAIDYQEGDIIKVWRRPDKNQTSDTINTLKITGNVLDKNNNPVDFTDGLSTIEKMNNTIFKVSNNGLQSFYNEAPKFSGLKDKVLYYGDSFNKLEGVTVSDDYQSLTLVEDNVTTDFVKDKIGTYTATYTVTDAFGRTTSQTININVKSKLEQNKINIHGATTSGEESKFSIGFNDQGNKFVLKGTELAIEKLPFDGTFQFTVYGHNGAIKHQVTINQEDTEDTVQQKLNQLKDISLTTGDSIALNHTNANYVKITGDIQDNSIDYSNGFDESTMSTVRLQLMPSGLKEIKAKEFTITANNSLTIKRGDEYNLLEGIIINHPTESIPLTEETIKITGFDISHIGEQTVTYTAMDSWGKTASITRQVTVEAMNEVDTNKIHVKSQNLNAKKLTIGFDALEMKLTANPQDNIITKVFKDLPTDTVAFSLSIYDNHQELQNTYTFDENDITTNSDVMEQINNQIFTYGDYIALTAYNYDKLEFEGNVTLDERNHPTTSKLDNSSISVNKEDFIMNARFQITEEGLVALYNEAPEITKKELAEDIEIEIGGEDKLADFIQISDDLDELSLSDIEIDVEEADFYYPGQYEITYIVTDTWGRSSSLRETIYVLSELDQSKFVVYSETNHQPLVTISFDSKTEHMTVSKNDQNNECLDSSKGNNEVMRWTIYNLEGVQLEEVALVGSDTAQTISEKLKKLTESEGYEYNSFINIDIVDEQTNNIVIENLTLNSEQIPDNAYQENIETNKDYFENVRFELDPQVGLVALYNEAPILQMETNQKEAIKSVNLKDYDLFSGIEILDDRDVLDDSNVFIYCNPQEGTTPNALDSVNNIFNTDSLHLGDNTLYYVVVDSWGRLSAPITLTLTLTHAMKNTEIVFDRVTLVQNADASSNVPALTVHYDPDTDKLYATHTEVTKFKDNYQAYTLDIYNKEGQRIYGVIYGVHDDNIDFFDESDYKIPSSNQTYMFNSPLGAATSFTDFFQQKDVTEGWSIRVRSVQAPFLKINGIVVDAQEDYSEGASINEILNESRFYITEEGLKQVYNPIEVESGKNEITWYSGVAGLKQFKLVYNPRDKTFKGEALETGAKERLDTMYRRNDTDTVGYDLFTISIYGQSGNEKFRKIFKTRQYASDVINAINDANLSIESGDYLEIELIERRRTNMRIYGEVLANGKSIDTTLYETGVPDLSYFNDARFYFTEHGLSLDYNEAPVFTGIEDTILFSGEEAINLRDGITVSDDNTPGITYKITNENNVTADNYDSIPTIDDTYSTDTVGAQEIYYVAKDSRDRITVEPRFIWVYARSQIMVPDESKLIVQEADPTLRTEDAVYNYLINMVQVTDEEDDAAGKPIQVTKDNIETNFNPMEPGEYRVTYKVKDSDDNESSATFTITVVRSISVSVPRNNIPFQVVTNLLGETREGQEFISGTIKVKNDYVTDVKMSVKSLTVSNEQPTKDGKFTLVDPSTISDWSAFSEEETMTKMALGLYAKSGINSINSITPPTKDNPIWLTTDMQKREIGLLPKGILHQQGIGDNIGDSSIDTRMDDSSDSSTSNPSYTVTSSEAVLGFTAKYGKKFTSGKHRMKFTMVLEFE